MNLNPAPLKWPLIVALVAAPTAFAGGEATVIRHWNGEISIEATVNIPIRLSRFGGVALDQGTDTADLTVSSSAHNTAALALFAGQPV